MDKICCDPYSPYRSLNGSCNNLKNPTWGMANSPYRRITPAEYDDSINDPKKKSAATGADLPNARLISTILHNHKPTPSYYSTLLIFFAQFVDHDMLTTASSTLEDGTPVVCECGSTSPDCVNIPIITKRESYFPPSTQCIPLVRSSASNPDYNCNLGCREQLNMQSSWADLSNLYSTDPELLKSMRDTEGKLKVSYSGHSVNLPYADQNAKCDSSTQSECYILGYFF